jgi:5-methylcytosine-specific restriction endonuclease McrA
MIAINKKKVADLMLMFKKEIKDHTVHVTDSLTNRLALTTNIAEQNYINALLTHGEKLIKADIAEIPLIKAEFDALKKIKKSDADKAFKDNIINDLGYSTLRSEFYPKYFKKLGIKSCVYCNSQLCITVDGEKKKLVARHQIDHYISKDQYPCLSIALFNLYPVCGSCNNKKSTKNLHFQLYAEEKAIKNSDYKFSIKDKDNVVPLYLSNRNPDILEVLFEEPPADAGHYALDQLFSIKSLYNTQIDIVEELILKRHIYDTSYKETLVAQFPKIFSKDDKILERLIMGNYYEENEIHNRPMAKFMQDIAKQLGFL